LRTVVSELGTAFRDNGDNLQTILDTTREFTGTAQRHLPQTKRLLSDGKEVLATQNEQGSAIRSYGENLRLLSDQLRQSDPDLRAVIDRAPRAAEQVSGTLQENEQLTPLLSNLSSTSQLLAKHNDSVEQLMVT